VRGENEEDAEGQRENSAPFNKSVQNNFCLYIFLFFKKVYEFKIFKKYYSENHLRTLKYWFKKTQLGLVSF